MRVLRERISERSCDRDASGEDSEALRLMLDYVVAECHRLGAAEAAQAAAHAAVLLAGVRMRGTLN